MTPQNGQTHSNSPSVFADELFECVWPFSGVGASSVDSSQMAVFWQVKGKQKNAESKNVGTNKVLWYTKGVI